MGDIVVGRRGFLVGAAGVVVLTGCGSGEDRSGSAASASPTPSGPVINSKDAGNIVTAEDLQELVSGLDRAIASGEPDQVQALLKIEDYRMPEWRQRITAVRTVPLEENRFYVTAPDDRMINASGGPVELSSTLVLTHRIPDCDAHPVAQTFTVQLVKPGEGQPVEVTRYDGLKDDDEVSPLPWELAEISSVAGTHATLLTRTRDLDAVRRLLPLADAAARDAMAAVPPARGARKLAFTLAWDRQSDEEAFGRAEKTIDRAAFCTYVSFVDPQQLADGTAAPSDPVDPGASRSGRILMRRSSREDDDYFQDVCRHEAVHALAGQWGTAPSWVAEGLAQWVGSGYSAGVRSREAARVRDQFSDFAADLVSEGFDFQAEATSYRNYQCSAAIFSWVEETRGRDEAVGLARRCYIDGAEDGVRRVLGQPLPAMLQEVEAWLPSW